MRSAEKSGRSPLQQSRAFFSSDVYLFEQNVTSCRWNKTGNQIEHGGLASTIGTDESNDLSSVDAHVELSDSC